MIFIAFQDRRGVPGAEKSETKVETSRQLQALVVRSTFKPSQSRLRYSARLEQVIKVCKQPVYSSNHDIPSI